MNATAPPRPVKPSRRFRPWPTVVVRATATALLLAATGAAWALPYTAAVGALSGRGATETVDYPGVAEVEETITNPSTGARRNTYARSSAIGMGLRVIDRATGNVPEAEAFIDIPDLVFSSLSSTDVTHAIVGYGGLLEGRVDLGGTGNASARLVVSARMLGSGVSGATVAGYDALFAKAREVGTGRPLPAAPVVVHEVLSGSALVELGRPTRFLATMFLRGGGDTAFGFFGPGIVQALFDNSFEFDPTAFFDLPDGITAHSASLGLVDNRLLDFIDEPVGPNGPLPEPGSVALLATGLLGLAWSRRRGAIRR